MYDAAGGVASGHAGGTRQFSANLPVDPGFVAFVGTCATRGLPVTVLSDGLDRVARQVLHGMGLDLPVISNQLVSIGGQNWRLHFPHSRDDCLATAGNCKCARLVGDMAGAAASTILIGDGRSDFCGATQADFVFAKGALLAHCQDHAIPHIGFQNFTDLAPAFIAWLGHRRTQGASAAGASEWSHPL